MTRGMEWAFPRPLVRSDRAGIVDFGADGMTLREYVAAQAMAGYLASFAGFDCPSPNPAAVADAAVAYADALLERLARDNLEATS